jgi:hypothetical protein
LESIYFTRSLVLAFQSLMDFFVSNIRMTSLILHCRQILRFFPLNELFARWKHIKIYLARFFIIFHIFHIFEGYLFHNEEIKILLFNDNYFIDKGALNTIRLDLLEYFKIFVGEYHIIPLI